MAPYKEDELKGSSFLLWCILRFLYQNVHEVGING
jgi:hypothetical protein